MVHSGVDGELLVFFFTSVEFISDGNGAQLSAQVMMETPAPACGCHGNKHTGGREL